MARHLPMMQRALLPSPARPRKGGREQHVSRTISNPYESKE
jgi:hypothetical protein